MKCAVHPAVEIKSMKLDNMSRIFKETNPDDGRGVGDGGGDGDGVGEGTELSVNRMARSSYIVPGVRLLYCRPIVPSAFSMPVVDILPSFCSFLILLYWNLISLDPSYSSTWQVTEPWLKCLGTFTQATPNTLLGPVPHVE